MRLVFPIFALLLVCFSAAAATSIPYADLDEQKLAKMATDSVLVQLSDAKSATFRNVHVHLVHKHNPYLPIDIGGKSYRAVCGEVNAKNDAGIKTWLRFIFIMQDSTIGVSSQEWETNCIDE